MIGSLISGGLSLAGGLFGSSDARDRQRREQEAYNAMQEFNAAQTRQVNNANYAIADQLEAVPLITDTLTERRTQHGVGSTSTSQNSVDVAGMMAAAEASGFNPVTFLRNGGMAAFTRTEGSSSTWGDEITSDRVRTSQTGHNAATAAQIRMPTPHIRTTGTPVSQAPGLGSILTGAATAAYGTYADGERRAGDQAFQRELLNTQLNAVQRAPQQSRSFYVPGTTTSGAGYGPTQGGGLSFRAAVPTGRPTPREVGPVTVTNPWQQANVDELTSDAAAVEERYGEIAAEIGGLRAGVNDFWKNVTNMNSQERYDAVTDFIGGLSVPRATPASRARDMGIIRDRLGW